MDRVEQKQQWEHMMRELQTEFPSFRLIPKEESLLMKIIYYGLLMFLWCPQFMTSYTTVLITWIYMPRHLIGKSTSYSILRHERIHMRDCIRTGIIPFAFSYLFLLPTVFTMRAFWEMRAYRETMREELERLGYISDSLIQHIEIQFTSSSYLWMHPFPRHAKHWIEKERNKILSEKASKDVLTPSKE